MRLSTVWFACVLGCLLLVPGTGRADQSVLVLGRISDDPKVHYGQLKPLLDYVVPRMADVGIREGRILMAPDARQMASYLRRGRVDWVTETVGTAMLLRQRSGAHPLLRTERGGLRRYHSVVFVRSDSPIHRLADLRGHSLALQGVYSTSAYLLPMLALHEHGLRAEMLASPQDHPADDAVGYLLSRSEANIAVMVHKRLADAGAFSGQDWDDERHTPAAFRRDFRIIHVTPDVPRALEMVRPGLAPAVEARLREVLLAAAADPQAAPALKAFFGTSAFLPLDAPSAAELRTVGSRLQRLRAEIE